jgi:hypothetical protein
MDTSDDIKKLIEKHPNDPHMGQGFNDARGDFPDSELHADFKNRKNHAGREQKRRKTPDIGVVRVPETSVPQKRNSKNTRRST